MRAGGINTAGAEAVSLLDWWALAGVDTLVDETPRDWLHPAIRPSAPAATPPPEHKPPADLAAMHRWLATEAMADEGASGRVEPAGDATSGLMLLADMPDPGDVREGRLLGGEPGRLLDRMLATIDRSRETIYLAPLAPLRPATGKLAPSVAESLGEAARQHAALVGPRAVLLLGDATSRAVLGIGLAEARGRTHAINQGGVIIFVITTFHPRFLLRQPAAKAEAWKDLRLLMGELAG